MPQSFEVEAMMNLAAFDHGATITFDATPQMMGMLEQLTRDSGQPLDVVLTQALALYRVALQVTSEGKHFGYATSADALDVEFTDLVSPRG